MPACWNRLQKGWGIDIDFVSINKWDEEVWAKAVNTDDFWELELAFLLGHWDLLGKHTLHTHKHNTICQLREWHQRMTQAEASWTMLTPTSGGCECFQSLENWTAAVSSQPKHGWESSSPRLVLYNCRLLSKNYAFPLYWCSLWSNQVIAALTT